MADSKMNIKLLIDTISGRVLFAEAGKDFVDFLFQLLRLDLGTVIWLLPKNGMIGSMANLYESIENLSENYLQPNQSNSLLKPKVNSVMGTSQFPLLTEFASPRLFKCSSKSRGYFEGIHDDYCGSCMTVSDDPKAICTECKKPMNVEMAFVHCKASDSTKGNSNEGGFVKGLVTYMVMDDLVVTPLSTVSSITLLNKFNIKEVGALKEQMVEVGMAEVCLLDFSIFTSI